MITRLRGTETTQMAIPRDEAKVLPVITDLFMYLTATPAVLPEPNVLPVIVPSVLAGDSVQNQRKDVHSR